MEATYFITAIGSLVTTIVALALYIKHLHRKYTADQNENLIKMTSALTKSSLVIENNTKAHEVVFQYLLNGKKK